MLVHRRVTLSSKFAGTHLYTWVERGTMRVKCLAKEHNTVPRPGLEPGSLEPESSALIIRPPHLSKQENKSRDMSKVWGGGGEGVELGTLTDDIVCVLLHLRRTQSFSEELKPAKRQVCGTFIMADGILKRQGVWRFFLYRGFVYICWCPGPVDVDLCVILVRPVVHNSSVIPLGDIGYKRARGVRCWPGALIVMSHSGVQFDVIDVNEIYLYGIAVSSNLPVGNRVKHAKFARHRQWKVEFEKKRDCKGWKRRDVTQRVTKIPEHDFVRIIYSLLQENVVYSVIFLYHNFANDLLRKERHVSFWLVSIELVVRLGVQIPDKFCEFRTILTISMLWQDFERAECFERSGTVNTII